MRSSPLRVLGRGYAVARDEQGTVLKRVAQLPAGKEFRLRRDGRRGAWPSSVSSSERLEAIVRKLEAEELDLDEALKLFEEGVERLRVAREQLAQAELKVKKVLEIESS